MKESGFMKTIKMQVYGLVQGVGFRFSTKKIADQLGIKGIVMNRSDGSVYIEAQSNPMNLEYFISQVKLSPSPSGRVDDIKISTIDRPSYQDFTIKYE